MRLVSSIALLAMALSFCNLAQKFTGRKTQGTNVNVNAPNPNNSGSNSQAARESTLLIQLISLEYRWKEAKAKGDTATLQSVFADEFTNTDENGRKYTKAEWIESLKGGDANLKTWKIDDAKLLRHDEETATMSFLITLTYKNGKTTRSRDTDSFVKRGGRWQVVSSQSTPA